MAARSPPATRLQRAFEELRREHRLLVEEDCACCGTCAHAECSELLCVKPDKVGYIFYHNQDLDLAAGGERHAVVGARRARDDMPETVPALVTCDCLREHGFEVDWNGDVRTRIKVSGPKGPERDYFRRQLEAQYAEFEEEWGLYGAEGDGGEEEGAGAEGGAAGKAGGQA